MKYSDLFKLIIKLLGLFYLLQLFLNFIPNQLAYITNDLNYNFGIAPLLFIIAIVIIWYLGFHYLIKYPEKIVNFLKLDQKFSNDIIPLNHLNSTHILNLGVFIFGGYLIINYASLVISSAYNLYKAQVPEMALPITIAQDQLLNSGLNVFFGILLITFRTTIVAYFSKK